MMRRLFELDFLFWRRKEEERGGKRRKEEERGWERMGKEERGWGRRERNWSNVKAFMAPYSC